MAGKSTISITLKLDSDGKGFKDLAKDAEGLKMILTSTVIEAQQLKGNFINFAALATGIDAMQRSFGQLQTGLQSLADAYAEQEVNETRLMTVMRQRMKASDDEIRSILDLASAQQELGVIGDEAQVAGAQQVATFLTQTQSLETLLPAMNNLLAQQKGLNATSQDAVNIGNLMGKVMQGQTAALTRVGITFDETEEKVLKFGTESERAAMLAQVITNNVGDMNAQLAQTESGQQLQLANRLGDIKEEIGGLVNGALPFVTITAQSSQALASVTTLISGMKTLSATVIASTKAFALSTAAFVKNKVATLAAAAAQKVVTAASIAWTGVQKVLNLVLTANPIGIIVVALGALVAAAIKAYNSCEGFRDIVDKVFGSIKQLAIAITNGLSKAIEWLCEKCVQAWEWLSKILGLGDKKAKVEVDVVAPKKAPTIDLGEVKAKYANYKPTAGSPATTKAPEWNDSARTLKGITDNIQILRDKLQSASIEEAALINQQIAEWQKKADAIENAGKVAEDNSPMWKEDASTLEDINSNIDLLSKKLQTASIEEAALINQQIAAWQKKADAIENAGKAVESSTLVWNDQAATLKDIGTNIEILNKQLETATLDEAALINQQIAVWNDKAEAIKKAGIAAEKTGKTTSESLQEGWGSIKGMASSVESITNALKGNGTAWQIVVSIVDGFISLYEGVKTIISVIDMLSAASAAHAVTQGVEAGAETAAATTRAAAAATNVATGATTIATNKAVAASFKELAAAEYMAAHASIPFAGFGIAMGFTSAMMAAVTAAGLPMLAEGGVATGPTLAMVGEYAGAAGNPEVIAPLDKLRGMLAPSGGVDFGSLEFKIKGRTLVAILDKENNIKSRS